MIVAIGGTDARYYHVSDLAIVIEVADSTVARDLGVKCALYATQHVPEYWVVETEANAVHQFWAATADGFAERRTVPLEGDIAAATMPALTINGCGIL